MLSNTIAYFKVRDISIRHILLFGNLNYNQEDTITIVNSVHRYILDSKRFKQ